MTKLRINYFLLIMIGFGFVGTDLYGQGKGTFGSYDAASVKTKGDWLVDPISQKSAIYTNAHGQLVLSNGLISRVFDIEKAGATVGIENLMTGEQLLRSIQPEALLEIDGHILPVGGLEGQPIHNYLLEEWIEGMEARPIAFKLQKYESGPTQARFDWMKRREWMPKDLPWPAPGKRMVFTYRGTEEMIQALAAQAISDDARQVLFVDEFKGDHSSWKIFASEGDERNSFINEGKAGEIMALANQSVYAEIESPKQAEVWMATLFAGTDQAASWGIGMALVTQSGQVLKANLRASDRKIGGYDGNQEQYYGDFDPGKELSLRAERTAEGLRISYAEEGKDFRLLDSFSLDPEEAIISFRVGKMDAKGGFSDYSEPGPQGRSRVSKVSVLGPVNSSQEGLQSLAYLKALEVKVYYEIYDGIPLMSKWIELVNQSGHPITVNSFKSEILALVEEESAVDAKVEWIKPNITVETDYRFGGMSDDNLYSSSISWNTDPSYKTQVNYGLQTPALLEAYPKIGPNKTLQTGDTLRSFRTWELMHDSWDRERKALATKRMYRSQAPWVTENPIMMHVRQADDVSVKKAIDQCAEVGFEMVIMTFGSGFEIENDSPENIERMKALADYAHTKGIALGGYSLLASRSISPKEDVIMPEGQEPRFGHSPCLESEWGINYFEKLYQFYQKTGQDILEHDGSYPGDVCASHDHPGHSGLEDSQWNQYQRIQEFYEWSRSKGIFLNVPDHYFMAGSNKTGMGYRETNWSLPRAQQEIIERQNIYDGTWSKTPSMGWMFVPLVEYHGGGKEATIEPLKDHLSHYEQRLANLFGAGVQACFRGPQLYDGPQTKSVVKKWVDFYKQHREVLDADIVHIRRPDGRDYDGLLHVNPHGKEKGMVFLYNPLDRPIEKEITIDLYYTGIKDNVRLKDNRNAEVELALDRDYQISLPINIPAHSQQWFVLESLD